MAEETLLPMIVVGRCGESQMLEGWHEREVDGRYGIPYRSTSGEATLKLKAMPGATSLNLLLSAPLGLLKRPTEGRIVFNMKKFAVPVKVETWVFRRFPLEITRDVLQIRFQAPDAISPEDVVGNGDARKLGLFISAIWQE